MAGFRFFGLIFFSNQWVPNPPLLTLFYPQMKVEVNIRRVVIMEELRGNSPEIRNESTRIQILASPFIGWVTLGKILNFSEPNILICIMKVTVPPLLDPCPIKE